jgi:hypothetical protein
VGVPEAAAERVLNPAGPSGDRMLDGGGKAETAAIKYPGIAEPGRELDSC